MTGDKPEVRGSYVDLNVDGATYQIFYLESGRGIPLVCQHTSASHNHQWRSLLRDPRVTGRFRVIAPDLPFHGKSDPPAGVPWWTDGYTLTADFFKEYLNGLVAELALDHPVFLGAATGGVIGLHLALETPSAFRAFVCLATAARTPGGLGKWASHPGVDSSALAEAMIDGVLSPLAPELDRRLTRWYYAHAGPGVLTGDMKFFAEEHDVSSSLSEIDAARTPVYLLAGEYDYLVPPELVSDTASQINGATMIVMEGLGHVAMSEDHDRFMSYLLPILDEIEAASSR